MSKTAPDRLLTRQTVIEMVGLATPTIYKKMTAGEFPRPIKIGRAARWSEQAVADWIEEQKARCELAA
jgi:prophage regulatory protein